MNFFENMSVDFLQDHYVPDVYQKEIYDINYDQLWNAGIRLISFDIDDTLAGLLGSPPEKVESLVANLKAKGFKVLLVTNANNARAHKFMEALRADGYVFDAHKPLADAFNDLMCRFELEPKQMAHVGNDLIDDVGGGKTAGVTACLVRRAGKSPIAVPYKKQVDQLIAELENRGLWRKHHQFAKNDQYYQYGEKPQYTMRRSNFKSL